MLTLEQGRVDLAVDPTEGKPFWVHTRTFRVQVLGTQFSVTPEQVSVREGHVQVSDHQGKVLARDLAGGATFSMNTAAVEARPGTREQRAEGQATDEAKPATSAGTRSTARDASSVLSQARKDSARGDTATASQLLDSLTQVRLLRTQQEGVHVARGDRPARTQPSGCSQAV